MAPKKIEARKKRQRRIRKTVSGTPERPRLSVFKSRNHIYAQIIDDTRGHTLCAASSLNGDFKDYQGHRGNVEAARRLGGVIGRRALEKGIRKVVFDRSGYPYHGRVKALSEAAREAGLEF
ncbi:MAG: 50S ribosomal protein L18 [Thermodesulfovibrionales bacterium]